MKLAARYGWCIQTYDTVLGWKHGRNGQVDNIVFILQARTRNPCSTSNQTIPPSIHLESFRQRFGLVYTRVVLEVQLNGRIFALVISDSIKLTLHDCEGIGVHKVQQQKRSDGFELVDTCLGCVTSVVFGCSNSPCNLQHKPG